MGHCRECWGVKCIRGLGFLDIVCAVRFIALLLHITNVTCTKIYRRPTLVNLLHVSGITGAIIRGILLVAKVAPSKWCVAK